VVLQRRPRAGAEVVAEFVVAAVGGVDVRDVGVDVGDDAEGLQLPRDDVAEDADEGEEPLAHLPGACLVEVPAVVEFGQVLDDRRPEHPADAQRVQQDQQQAAAAEAAEEGLRVGGGDGEDVAGGAAVEHVGVGGTAGEEPLAVVVEPFAEVLRVFGVVATTSRPVFFSDQRKAGIPRPSPQKIAPCAAGVVLGRPARYLRRA